MAVVFLALWAYPLQAGDAGGSTAVPQAAAGEAAGSEAPAAAAEGEAPAAAAPLSEAPDAAAPASDGKAGLGDGAAADAVAAAAEAAKEPGPDEVIVGVYINDIQELDFRTNSYAVDLYVWFRWRNKDLNPSKSMEFMNRYAPSDHVRDNLYEEPKAMPDGSVYGSIRSQGRFSTKFGLEKYPFDEQKLLIVLEDSVSPIAELVMKADRIPITMNPDVTLPGFRVGQASMAVVARTYPTDFGDLTMSEADTYARATITIPVTRPMTALSVKTFVPILLIILCSSLVFFVRPIYVDGRIGLGITALLTLVALQLTAGSSLPEVDYLTLIDKVYLVSYAFIIAALFRIVTTSWVGAVHMEESRIARSDRIWAALLVLTYLGANAGLVFWTLSR